MGRVSGRWPAGDGAPRPPGRKSDHPQDQRQDLSHPSGQKRGKSGLRAEAVSFFPISAPTGGQIVTPHLAPSRPPYWYPFSPPPTITRISSGDAKQVLKSGSDLIEFAPLPRAKNVRLQIKVQIGRLARHPVDYPMGRGLQAVDWRRNRRRGLRSYTQSAACRQHPHEYARG